MSGSRKGQAGDWWIIVAGPEPKYPPLYWMGGVYKDGRAMWSYIHTDAAQFDTEEQAEFNANLLAVPGEYHPEQHGWS